VSSARNVQKLIAEWVRLTGHRQRSEPQRGYDMRHLREDIDRERAIQEAQAAVALAREYATKPL
jgi:hypothetical protein